MYKRNNTTLYEKFPNLLIYLKNPEDAKNFKPFSSRRIRCKCPKCGAEKDLIIEQLSRYGFSCTACGDGVSYPNKFINELLNQLKVKHIPEYYFEWSERKHYDQYLPDFNMIIENNGSQHYFADSQYQFPLMNLDMQQNNDIYKKDLALQNGIKYYVYIDCSKSSIAHIKQSVISSILPDVLSFTEDDIDWNKCGQIAASSIMHRVWDMWNNNIPVSIIVQNVMVGETTIRTYINQGVECGVCKPFYHVDKETRQARKDNSEYTNGLMKPIYCVTDNIYFASRFDCENYYSDLFPKSGSYLLYKNITNGRPYKGKQFIYISQQDFNNYYFNEAVETYGRPFKLE